MKFQDDISNMNTNTHTVIVEQISMIFGDNSMVTFLVFHKMITQ